ncbi:bifunctional methylenetetrahydrofolate dehydrogenase/methenyltetrahydrofolate cyclohydrolase FolD [Candidatus Poribacteria bacterium]|nr:bifunctional methylenetetrahydrofolate dehydrogenase/methenyltetrahydrofolate cyclohydrolase FolD [Candidatus Poribacteria bacterium]
MAAKKLSGTKVARAMRKEMAAEVERLKADHGVVPGLAVVLVGDNPASVSYVSGKRKACEEVAINSLEHKRDADFTEEALLELIAELNADPAVNGILVQLPLPDHIDEHHVLDAIDPSKDVDGFHPINLGRMLVGEECLLPCTPHGVQQLLLRGGVDIEGKHVVMVGRSNIVGKPLANILLQRKEGSNATVTVCHTRTPDMAVHTRQADILIVAAGRPNTITADMVADGAVVVDVGVNRIEDASRERGFRLVGDVDYAGVREKASLITPVPGGVGPMTITMLLHNTIAAAKTAHGVE